MSSNDFNEPKSEKINSSFFRCVICDLRQGACIKCTAPGCKVWFHVTCALRSGYEMRIEQFAVNLLFQWYLKEQFVGCNSGWSGHDLPLPETSHGEEAEQHIQGQDRAECGEKLRELSIDLLTPVCRALRMMNRSPRRANLWENWRANSTSTPTTKTSPRGFELSALSSIWVICFQIALRSADRERCVRVLEAEARVLRQHATHQERPRRHHRESIVLSKECSWFGFVQIESSQTPMLHLPSSPIFTPNVPTNTPVPLQRLRACLDKVCFWHFNCIIPFMNNLKRFHNLPISSGFFQLIFQKTPNFEIKYCR